jgi:hypothetical protein
MRQNVVRLPLYCALGALVPGHFYSYLICHFSRSEPTLLGSKLPAWMGRLLRSPLAAAPRAGSRGSSGPICVARQATDALGGYVYQLDHTVMTWLTLGDDEALHIEFAEDVAISKNGKLDLTQIKRVKANITLRSDGVAKLITSVWEFQKENPDRQVSGALLTTSGIGKEKGMSFPDNNLRHTVYRSYRSRRR